MDYTIETTNKNQNSNMDIRAQLAWRSCVSVRYVLILSLLLVTAALTSLQPALVGKITEQLSINRTVEVALIVVTVIVFIADAILVAVVRIALGRLSESFLESLRVKLFRSVTETSFESSRRFDKGDLNNRFVEDVPPIPQAYYHTYPELFTSGLVVLFCIVGMFLYSYLLLGIVSIIALLVLTILVFLLRRIRHVNTELRNIESKFSSQLYELLQNLLTIHSLHFKKWARRKIALQAKKARLSGQRVVLWNATLEPMINLGIQASLVIVVLTGGMLLGEGRIGVSELTSFLLYLVYLISPLVTVAMALGELQSVKVSRDRVAALLDKLPSEHSKDSELIIKTDMPTPGVLFETRDLTYRFDDGNELHFENTRFEGSGIIHLTGDNGAGKSTLLGLLSGLLQPTGGQIQLSSPDKSASVHYELTQADIFYYPTNRTLFTDTVRENILLGSKFSDDEIYEAAAKIGFDTFLFSLPHKLDTLLGTEDVELSSGETQLIFFLHAFLVKPRILFLDEPWSNIDTSYRTRLCQLLEKLAAESLVILTSHQGTSR